MVVVFVCSEEKGQGGKLDWLTVGELKRGERVQEESGSNKAGIRKSQQLRSTHCGIHIVMLP